ncbi:MAG: hypothetical protein KDC64_04710, partial [Aequorivita sp.]|nr:hypothetical protein [Aequorivita sp.]
MKFLKISCFIITLTLCGVSFSQQRETADFGNPTAEEFALQSYSKDPDAAGVVLFEKGNYYFELVENYVKLIKEVHVKMKVFNAKNFDQANVEIPFYNEKNNNESITKITAITHNGTVKTFINEANIFETDENPYWSLKKFTFPS